MSELEKVAITLPMDDWEFMAIVLASQAADYDLMAYVKPANDCYAMLAQRCRALAEAIRNALGHHPGKFEKARNLMKGGRFIET